MGLIHSPSIVSDGLVLALDAQNSRSYGGSGTTWTDVSYNGNNGTLTNGPTFEPGGPFAGSTGGSVYFDGTGDYLSVPSNSDFSFGTGDFTVEYWVYSNSLPLLNYAAYVTDFRGGNTNNFTFGIINSGGTLKTYSWGNSVQVIGSTSLSTNTWYHIAHVRNGSTVTVYLNGSSDGSMSNSFNQSSTGLIIGARHTTTQEYVNGFISNLRVLKGTALYTSNFTPPTKPLTPVSGTSLLTCQGGAIVDNSSNKFSITKNGDARAIQSASIKFDGVSDYVDIGSSTDFSFGTGDFTVECWIYTTNTTSDTFYRRIYMTDGPTGNAGGNFQIALEPSTGKVNLWDGVLNLLGTSNVCNGVWHHVVGCRSGTTLRLFVDGVLESSTTYSTSVSPNSGSPRPRIGSYSGTTGDFDGYISSIKSYKGKGLTAEEVQQNFNALRGRFGV